MKRRNYLLILSFSLLFFGGLSAAQIIKNDLTPGTILESVRGRVSVLIFVRTECPISNRYAPTIQRISMDHAAETSFFLIFPDKSESRASIQKYISEFGYKIPAVQDLEHLLVKRAQADFTPEAAVFDRRGTLVYHGRIDNLYASVGHARPSPTTHELEDALRAVLAGRAPTLPHVEGVGCYVSDL